MKCSIVVLVLATALAGGPVKAEKDTPASVQSLKILQREPPAPLPKTRAIIKTDWIEQQLDHFDASETRTWKMRYMENSEFWQAGGPMFIYFGGEWEISPGMISGGHFYDMAREHKGMLYYTEHRYYGRSTPTDDITVENLGWLHVKQALADVAHFIKTKRATVEGMADAKVIIAGGSYSATMVVWFKLLYPELVAGGWASSAPLLAKVDFWEYKEVVGRSFLELGSQQCYNRIQKGIAELQSLFEQKRGAEVRAMMKICNRFDENNDLDLWTLFSTISNVFSGIAQYQSGDDVPNVCNYLLQFDNDADAIATFILSFFDDEGCTDVTYKSMLTYYMDSTYEEGASRPWYYQTCNEYGWYQSSASPRQPFGNKFPALLYTTLCGDVFGQHYSNEQIRMNAAQTNVDFSGQNVSVENVYQTHGALDPWHPMGHGVAQGAVLIPTASHCADFGSISASDSAEMQATKKRIAELVRQWLGVADIRPAGVARKFSKKFVQ